MYVYIYIYIYTSYTYITYIIIHITQFKMWILGGGGCSRRGVQWMGVVSYNKLVYNIM